jgi:hypothetical protein
VGHSRFCDSRELEIVSPSMGGVQGLVTLLNSQLSKGLHQSTGFTSVGAHRGIDQTLRPERYEVVGGFVSEKLFTRVGDVLQ